MFRRRRRSDVVWHFANAAENASGITIFSTIFGSSRSIQPVRSRGSSVKRWSTACIVCLSDAHTHTRARATRKSISVDQTCIPAAVQLHATHCRSISCLTDWSMRGTNGRHDIHPSNHQSLISRRAATQPKLTVYTVVVKYLYTIGTMRL